MLCSCEGGIVEINLYSVVFCSLISYRSKGVMCEILRRTREIHISDDIIIFWADKLWKIVRWNLHLSRNLFGNWLWHESKTFPLNLMYICVYKVSLLILIEESKLGFASKSFVPICIIDYLLHNVMHQWFVWLRTLRKLWVVSSLNAETFILLVAVNAINSIPFETYSTNGAG